MTAEERQRGEGGTGREKKGKRKMSEKRDTRFHQNVLEATTYHNFRLKKKKNCVQAYFFIHFCLAHYSGELLDTWQEVPEDLS